MSTLTDFLLARIAEDEERAFDLHTIGCDIWREQADGTCACSCLASVRALAECEAKRRIVEDFLEQEAVKTDALACGDAWVGDLWMSATCRALQHLAAFHADHPDYREEWRL